MNEIVEISLIEFMAQPNMSQARAGKLLGRSQAGIGFILKDIQTGKRDFRIVLNEAGEPSEILTIKREVIQAAPSKAA